MNTVEEILEEIRFGRPVVLTDDEDRENEGDLVIAADAVTPEWINFMIKECRGLVCLSLTEDQVQRLGLPLMVQNDLNFSPHKTAFTLSIEAANGVTTGISAFDRSHTIKVAIQENVSKKDIVIPGHIFPLKAQTGGVLKRAGHSEGSVDLARLAGRNPSAVICEILAEDGSMARIPELEKFALKHGLKIGSIAALIQHRLRTENFVTELASSSLPTEFGKEFRVRVFESALDKTQHVVLQLGEANPNEPFLVRVHSECMTGDVFGSLRCDCGKQLHSALEKIAQEGSGAVVYLRQEGRGIGLANKIRAYSLQETGMDTVEANVHLGFKPDERDYGIGAQILRLIGANKLRLLTNNPAKRAGLGGYGIQIVERVPLNIEAGTYNQNYLKTKKLKLGHLLTERHDIETGN